MAEDRSIHGEAFNFSNELQVDVLALTTRILDRMGVTSKPDVRAEARHEIQHQWLSAAKARRELGLDAWTPLSTSIRLMGRYLQAFGPHTGDKP